MSIAGAPALPVTRPRQQDTAVRYDPYQYPVCRGEKQAWTEKGREWVVRTCRLCRGSGVVWARWVDG